MKTVLITGCAGNIGSSLCSFLKSKKNIRIIGIDNFSTGNSKKLPSQDSKFIFYKLNTNNLEDMEFIFNKYKFTEVFHFAAVVGVKRTIEKPLRVMRDIKGIENLLRLSVRKKINRFFFSSSSEVYGEPVEVPLKENESPLNAKLPYSIVKNLGESLIKSYSKVFGLNYSIFRFFNTYGPNQSKDFVIPKFLHKAINNQNIEIYGDGSQTRTFCYINDNIETIYLCLIKNLCVNETLNIGSDVEYTIENLAKKIIDKTNSKSTIIFLPPLQEGDVNRRKPDISIMKKLLGRDLTPLNLGIDYLINHISLSDKNDK